MVESGLPNMLSLIIIMVEAEPSGAQSDYFHHTLRPTIIICFINLIQDNEVLVDHSFAIASVTNWIFPVTVGTGPTANQYVVTKVGKHFLGLQVRWKICFITTLQNYDVPNENLLAHF